MKEKRENERANTMRLAMLNRQSGDTENNN